MIKLAAAALNTIYANIGGIEVKFTDVDTYFNGGDYEQILFVTADSLTKSWHVQNIYSNHKYERYALLNDYPGKSAEHLIVTKDYQVVFVCGFTFDASIMDDGSLTQITNVETELVEVKTKDGLFLRLDDPDYLTLKEMLSNVITGVGVTIKRTIG